MTTHVLAPQEAVTLSSMRSLVLVAALAASAAFAGESVCVPGARVKDRHGVRGTALESVDRGTACNWKTDDGKKKYALNWMLSREDAVAPTAALPGTYRCSLGAAGQFLLTIASDTIYSTAYTGEPGKSGAFKNASGKLTFTSGPLEGNFGAVLGDGEIGLSSKAETKSHYAVCHLAR